MIGCRSLIIIRTSYTQAWRTTKNLQCQQYKYEQFHCLSSQLRMDYTKRKQRLEIANSRKEDATVKQTWRKVSTQPSYQGSKEEVQQSGGQEMHHSTSQAAYKDDTDPKVVNEPVDAPACSSTVGGSSSDLYVDGKLIPSMKHSVSIEIGSSLMRFVRGKEGYTREEIEEEFGVKIVFLNSKKEESIIIESNSAESVAKASEKIQSIIDKAVNSREFDYSHFVSLPLAIHPGLVEKLVNFQNMILGADLSDKNEDMDSGSVGDVSNVNKEGQSSNVSLKDGKAGGHVEVNITSYLPKESKAPAPQKRSPIELGIEKSIFIKPKTFHLTVLMLKLWNKERVKAASEVLQSVSSRVMDALDGRPVSIRLKGLDCMRGSLTKTRVLYAPVEEVGSESRLLRACQVITDAFVEAGLVMEKDVHQKLKLHATLMNARHRKRRKGTRKLDSFDARGIFDLYGSEEWGEYHIREAHLSQRFVFDENGYYHCCASIPFPDNLQAK